MIRKSVSLFLILTMLLPHLPPSLFTSQISEASTSRTADVPTSTLQKEKKKELMIPIQGEWDGGNITHRFNNITTTISGRNIRQSGSNLVVTFDGQGTSGHPVKGVPEIDIAKWKPSSEGVAEGSYNMWRYSDCDWQMNDFGHLHDGIGTGRRIEQPSQTTCTNDFPEGQTIYGAGNLRFGGVHVFESAIWKYGNDVLDKTDNAITNIKLNTPTPNTSLMSGYQAVSDPNDVQQ